MPRAPPNVDHAIPEKSREKQHDRSRDEHQQREPPIHPKQHDSYADKKKNVRKENLHALNQHTFQRFGISRYPCYQSAGRTFIEKFKRETLQMPENIIAQFVRKLLSEPCSHSPAPHSQSLPQKLNSAKCQNEHGEQTEALFKRAGMVDGIQYLIRQRTGEIDGHKAETKADNHRNPNKDDLALVWLEIDQHAADGFTFAHAGRANL